MYFGACIPCKVPDWPNVQTVYWIKKLTALLLFIVLTQKISNFIFPLMSFWSLALILLSGLHQKWIDKINLQVSQLQCYQNQLFNKN